MLKVGCSKVCITPPKEMFPFPTWLGNQLTDVYFDIYVRALVLDNGEKRIAVISWELTKPFDKETKKFVSEATGIPVENIVYSATHNHSAPLRDRKQVEAGCQEFDWQLDRTVEAVNAAIADLRPAKYGYGEGKSYINVNRDYLAEDGNWVQAQNYELPSDKTVYIIKFEDYDGQLIAAMVNYACHPTVGFLAKDVDGQIKLSGDFPGFACDYVEKRYGLYGREPVILWFNGACGDQNPAMAYLGLFNYDGSNVQQNDADFRMVPGGMYFISQHVGQQHAMSILKALKTISCDDKDTSLFVQDRYIDLPAQKAPEGVDMLANQLKANISLKPNPDGTWPDKGMVKMIDDPEHPVHLYTMMLNIGDITVYGLGCEAYNMIGTKCRRAFGDKKLLLISHVGPTAGYVLDEDSVDHNCFEAFRPPKPGASDNIIKDNLLYMYENRHLENHCR